MSEAALTLAAWALFIAGCWLTRGRRTPSLVAWALAPLLAVAAIVQIDLLTSDASVAAQIFFFFPTLYGASQLPRAGAIVMTAASVVGEAIVVLTLLPLEEALIDIGYVSAALVTTAVILIRSGERQAELVENLERLAAMDPLTGLVTRRVLDEAAKSAISGAASVAGTSLILLDIDNFKSINDRHGHPGGDEVLVQLAGLLVDSARHDDVVCRIGGDEMALLLPGCSVPTLRDRAQQIVQDVRARRFALSSGQEATVSVSVGLAHAPTDASDLQSLYVKADQTLYDAKRFGRNRVGIVADSTALLPASEPSASQGRPQQLERLIRDALDDGADPGGLSADHRPLLRPGRRGRGPAEVDRRSGSPPSCGGSDLGRGGLRPDRRTGTPRSSRSPHGSRRSGERSHGVLLPIAVNVSAVQVGLSNFPRGRPGGDRRGRRTAGGAVDRADGVRAAGDRLWRDGPAPRAA